MPILWILVIALIILAVAGGVAVSNFLWLVLVIALIVAVVAMKDHEEPLHDVSFVPAFEDIAVDYDAGTSINVTMGGRFASVSELA